MIRVASTSVLLVGSLIPAAGAQASMCNGKPATLTGSLVYGTEGDDVIVGTEGDDRIFAEGGNDTICGLGGRDTMTGDLGEDHIDGGEGRDLLAFWTFGVGPTSVDLAGGTASGGEGSDVIVVGTVENVAMNCSADNADMLVGDDRDNFLSGGSGADTIVGNGGNDLIYGTDSSVDRTDAICWDFQGDEDSIDGGEGDDIIFGQISNDFLEGGAGWDILDGGHEQDRCANGERYVRCEIEETPEPAAECDNGVDDDGDGLADHPEDPGCAHPADPTEDRTDDPNCNDGIDNDGDGSVDYPEDFYGCFSLEDETELDQCVFCPDPSVTIEHRPRRSAFTGEVLDFERPRCATGRRVVLKKYTDGRFRAIARDRTNKRGVWSIAGFTNPTGRFVAQATRKHYVISGGEPVTCEPLRSRVLHIRRH
jgi:RTX calcium-binding nonapeptide repeat (4 copies)